MVPEGCVNHSASSSQLTLLISLFAHYDSFIHIHHAKILVVYQWPETTICYNSKAARIFLCMP